MAQKRKSLKGGKESESMAAEMREHAPGKHRMDERKMRAMMKKRGRKHASKPGY